MNIDKFNHLESNILEFYSKRASLLVSKKTQILRDLMLESSNGNGERVQELSRDRAVIDKNLLICKRIIMSVRDASNQKNENLERYVIVISKEVAKLNSLNMQSVAV